MKSRALFVAFTLPATVAIGWSTRRACHSSLFGPWRAHDELRRPDLRLDQRGLFRGVRDHMDGLHPGWTPVLRVNWAFLVDAAGLEPPTFAL